MFFDTRPKVSVHVMQTGETFPCATDESLLQGMLRLGRKGIPVGCVNGGCGVCKVHVIEGQCRPLGPVSRAHVSAAEEARGFTLACRVAPVTPVQLEVVGKFEKVFSKGFVSSTNEIINK
ncbi:MULTISPECIES: 2Fe-2S iron-sulfur cluster binding domain-containing protein [Pseudomonadaceae]|uniref:CbzT n=4 Tax=Pseudomonas TaxID=286 RepID=Q9Z418_PSEPU|nr:MULTISPECIES: 2Fe-2S iron-sulfur cluster binding domain-containing protein [Pseudomonadaceae]AAD05249.1 ferredoxin [Pseudomonas putida]AAP51202.1 ferredoxin [Pseudomonas fluorescens]AAX38580.1 CbzT [Pseudomonas putida]ABA25981.1 CbzT [Pseudomonas sp. CT14]MCQ4323258.1 2Fe-2S iron-sulfur cluster binding domain-containing protein [Stutzerimonas stutzeri]